MNIDRVEELRHHIRDRAMNRALSWEQIVVETGSMSYDRLPDSCAEIVAAGFLEWWKDLNRMHFLVNWPQTGKPVSEYHGRRELDIVLRHFYMIFVEMVETVANDRHVLNRERGEFDEVFRWLLRQVPA